MYNLFSCEDIVDIIFHIIKWWTEIRTTKTYQPFLKKILPTQQL